MKWAGASEGSLHLILPILAFPWLSSPFPAVAQTAASSPSIAAPMTLEYAPPHWLVIRNSRLPGEEVRINYIEAYCRGGSTDADWIGHTVIPHETEVRSLSADHKTLHLRDTLIDGVVIEHEITAREDEIEFLLNAHNPLPAPSEVQWAQPCVRLGNFTGFATEGENLDDYLPKCFIFLGGKLTRLSEVRPWATSARYTPGQVWCPAVVPRTDVNPRPLSPLVPSNGLIGAFSADESWLFGTAWEPYQELFQGVARCLHSDFRIGGLQPGETKRIRGKIYLIHGGTAALLKRYEDDFPEHMSVVSQPAAPKDPAAQR